MRTLIAAALILAALPATAKETSGTVLTFDKAKNIVVLTDKTVWDLRDATTVPADLAAGEKVRIEYVSEGEDCIERTVALTAQ